MDAKKLVEKFLPTINIMQLATSFNHQPWVCTVHFFSDDDLNLYWASTLDRRHSQDIRNNQKAAATIMVHENTPDENYVIGITLEGKAELIGEEITEEIGKGFMAKHSRPKSLLDDIRSSKNPHKFYKLVPSKIVLFDNKNFPDEPRQEIKLNA